MKATKFNPFWIVETCHDALQNIQDKTKVDSEKMGTMEFLAYIHHWNKKEYKNTMRAVKKHPNLFSKKDLVISKENQLFSLQTSDLRSPFVGQNAYFINLLASCYNKIILDKINVLAKKEGNKVQSVMTQIFKKNWNERGTLNFFGEDSMAASVCKEFKLDFSHMKKDILLLVQQMLQRNKFDVFVVTKTVLEDAGNQLLSAELLLKDDNNGLLATLREAYSVLRKNIVLNKNYMLTYFINGLSLNNFDQKQLEKKIDAYAQGIFWDLPDFGLFAHLVKLSRFTNNTFLYAGDGHIKNIEKLLKKSGFACIWSKQSKIGESISQKDCEAFFQFNLPKKN